MKKQKFIKGPWKYKNKNERFKYANDLWTKKAKKKFQQQMKHEGNIYENNIDYLDDFEKRLKENFLYKPKNSKLAENEKEETKENSLNIDLVQKQKPESPKISSMNYFEKQQKIAERSHAWLLNHKKDAIEKKKEMESLFKRKQMERKQTFINMTAKTRKGQPKMQSIIKAYIKKL